MNRNYTVYFPVKVDLKCGYYYCPEKSAITVGGKAILNEEIEVESVPSTHGVAGVEFDVPDGWIDHGWEGFFCSKKCGLK